MDAEPVIVARQVRKRYGRTVVLDGIDLEIPRGSVVGLLGKNGAGKSTLLRCLLGLSGIDAGTARVLGRDPQALDDDVKARIGYVPQQPRLQPWMAVDRLIAYTAAFYPSWDTALVERLLGGWQVPKRKRVGTLSGGQVQKLAMILALGPRPELMILDEPAASLDPQARRDFLMAVNEAVSERQCTVLLSTHLTTDLERFADRVVLVVEGRVAFSGEIAELKDTVKQLRIARDSGLPERLDIPGAIASERSGNTAVVTVRGDVAAARERAERELDATVEVRDLSLEDIFLEMHP